MPELPDLQVFASNLNKQLKNRKITGVVVHVAKAADKPQAALKKLLTGKKLLAVERDGKELMFRFDAKTFFTIHLMLHGKLFILPKGEATKHQLIELVFGNKKVLIITDFQKQANLKFAPPEKEAPDALAPEVKYSFLRDIFSRKSIMVKKVLMDQKLIRGIGNAYADEILWAARISPMSIAKAIPDDNIKILATKIKSVLRNAEKQILKHHPGIISGQVRDFMKVHNPGLKDATTGAEIRTAAFMGRKTYFTDEQELFE